MTVDHNGHSEFLPLDQEGAVNGRPVSGLWPQIPGKIY